MQYKSVLGLSIFELLIALSISSITLGLGVPFAGNIINSNRVAGQINALRGALALTRSEAIKRNQHVVLCKSNDGEQCTRKGDWSQGWIVYVDQNQNRKRDAKEALLRVHGKITNDNQLNYRGFGSHNYIVYRPTGFTQMNGTFTLCSTQAPARSRALILIKTGRVRLSQTRADGSPLKCSNSVNSAS